MNMRIFHICSPSLHCCWSPFISLFRFTWMVTTRTQVIRVSCNFRIGWVIWKTHVNPIPGQFLRMILSERLVFEDNFPFSFTFLSHSTIERFWWNIWKKTDDIIRQKMEDLYQPAWMGVATRWRISRMFLIVKKSNKKYFSKMLVTGKCQMSIIIHYWAVLGLKTFQPTKLEIKIC